MTDTVWSYRRAPTGFRSVWFSLILIRSVLTLNVMDYSSLVMDSKRHTLWHTHTFSHMGVCSPLRHTSMWLLLYYADGLVQRRRSLTPPPPLMISPATMVGVTRLSHDLSASRTCSALWHSRQSADYSLIESKITDTVSTCLSDWANDPLIYGILLVYSFKVI